MFGRSTEGLEEAQALPDETKTAEVFADIPNFLNEATYLKNQLKLRISKASLVFSKR
jgi:hypothetical protein